VSKYDWEKIEKEYRTGQLSIREIAKQNDCPESSIRARMKKRGITRDLTKEVARKIKEKVTCADVRTPNANDEQKVEEASDRGFSVLMLQRKDIESLRALENKILSELENEPTKLYMAQYQGKVIQEEVGIPVTEKAAALNNLANVQHKRIQLERQAYNLNDSEDSDGKVTITLTQEEANL
jgi:polygalacturonase